MYERKPHTSTLCEMLLSLLQREQFAVLSSGSGRMSNAEYTEFEMDNSSNLWSRQQSQWLKLY